MHQVEEVTAALDRFSSWLDEVSPYHRALKTPVYLEPDAPLLVRTFWERVGWSEATAPSVAPPGLRPERAFADHAAMKVIRGWLSSPRVRDQWGVSSPREIDAAVRSKLPERSRFVLATEDEVTFTDETTGAEDPPVLQMYKEGNPAPCWPSYVEMLACQTCENVGFYRQPKLRGAPLPAGPARERPFAPAFDGFWTLADGVWAVAPPPEARGGPNDLWQCILYQTPEQYFRYVRDLPDGQIERISLDGLTIFTVEDAGALDPEHPSVPAMRRFEHRGRSGPSACWGLVEVEGLRLWIEKHLRPHISTHLHAEPKQAAAVKAYLLREKIKIIQELKPHTNPLARKPTAKETAAAKALHDRARAAAEGKKG